MLNTYIVIPLSRIERRSRPFSEPGNPRGLSLDDLVERPKAVEEGGAGGQDVLRGDLIEAPLPDRLDPIPARPSPYAVEVDRLPAPGSHDDVGVAPDHLGGVDDPLAGSPPIAELREHVLSTGGLDQLR